MPLLNFSCPARLARVAVVYSIHYLAPSLTLLLVVGFCFYVVHNIINFIYCPAHKQATIWWIICRSPLKPPSRSLTHWLTDWFGYNKLPWTRCKTHICRDNWTIALLLVITAEINNFISQNETQFSYYSIQLMPTTIHLHLSCDR